MTTVTLLLYLLLIKGKGDCHQYHCLEGPSTLKLFWNDSSFTMQQRVAEAGSF